MITKTVEKASQPWSNNSPRGLFVPGVQLTPSRQRSIYGQYVGINAVSGVASVYRSGRILNLPPNSCPELRFLKEVYQFTHSWMCKSNLGCQISYLNLHFCLSLSEIFDDLFLGTLIFFRPSFPKIFCVR